MSPATSDETASARAELVAAWLRALAPTGFTPMPRPDFERIVADLVAALADGMAAQPAGSAEVAAIGRNSGRILVGTGFTDAESLRASLRTLAHGLLTVAELDGGRAPVDRAFGTLAAFGAGYAAALRDWLFEQQEEVKVALQRATGEAERKLKRSEAWFREVFVRSAVGIAISDSGGKLEQANPALAEILGVAPDGLVGRSIEEFFHPQDAIDLRSDYHELSGLGGKPLRRRRRLVRADGQLVWAHLTVSVLRDVDELPALHLTMVENVSDLHLLQDLTSHQSLHDVLTRLPNRQYLLSQLQSQLAGQVAGEQVTLFHLDLDGFGAINHGLGPADGDRLLAVVATRLENLFAGRRALVARLSGDEFAVLFSTGCTPAEVIDTIGQINEQLAEPVHLPPGGVGLSVSIGVAHGPVGGIEPSELLRRADVALRHAQATGKRQWAEFDRHRDEVDRRRATLASTLSGALEFGELSTSWQPWVSFEDGRYVGISVKVLWDHPESGRIEHAECLRLAEMTGASVPLATWLIDECCEQAKGWWARFGDRTPLVGLGLSVSQVADPDLVATVSTAVQRTGIRPSALCLGVPVDAVAASQGEARDNMGVLRGMGVRVLLGDAGVAPVEMMLLDEWPMRAVQLAESLVTSLAEAGTDSRLARAGGGLVRGLAEAGINVLVPALRTAAEASWWRHVGARAACGPYFGTALTPEQIAVRLAERLGPPSAD
ncbi:MAG TPA: EAL domain-containing protein [Pseudonocardiaceae bacterium]|jgi:diguanylate cyclase (GGDEF)-like protein/PAS domain S-box-containing protein|nr:EAL domain-containing protein [Pseudonocardiaceae bacterium]